MKNSINFLLAALMLLATALPFNVNANPIEDDGRLLVKVAPSEKGKAFELMLANLNNQPTKIKVVDVVGYSLYSETVAKQTGYSKLVNLENLPIGDYLLHVQHPTGNFTHAFHLGGEMVTFFEAKKQNGGFTQLVGQTPKSAMAVFSVKNNLLNVEVNKPTDETARVHVCDLNGKMLMGEKIKKGTTASQSFDTGKLREGIYMMVVRTDKQTSIQPFEITANGIHLKNTLVSKPLELGKMEVYTQR